MLSKLIIGSRKSKLALAQTKIFIDALSLNYPEIKSEVRTFSTKGDEIQNKSLELIGGKGLFVKPLEKALIEGEIDVAIHSMKDVPANLSEVNPDLTVPCILTRDNPSDVFISNIATDLLSLPLGSSIGTSSPRRKMQIHNIRPDIKVHQLRGNIITRLMKATNFSAIILAYAGLNRLNILDNITSIVPHDQMLPAASQGAIGAQCLKNKEELVNILSSMNHNNSHICVTAERAFLEKMNGNCTTAIAAFAEIIDKDKLFLKGQYFYKNKSFYINKLGYTDKPKHLGYTVADDILSQINT